MKEPAKEPETFFFHVPLCCKEGWESCVHVVNQDPARNKKNIGL